MITKRTEWRKTRDLRFSDWVAGEKIDLTPQLVNKEYLVDFEVIIEFLPAQPMDGQFNLRYTLDGQFVETQISNVVQMLPNGQIANPCTVIFKMINFKDLVIVNSDGTNALNFGLTLLPKDITQGEGKARIKCIATYDSFYE